MNDASNTVGATDEDWDPPPKDKFREFLYVDVERARSFLAQLDRGIVENIREQRLSSTEGGLDASIFGVGARALRQRGVQTEESRSLQDLVFVQFEEAAEEQGLIWDLEDDYKEKESWASGWVHESLHEGQIVRIVSDISLLDPTWFSERLERFDEMMDAIVRTQGGEVFKGKAHPKQRDKSRAIEAVKNEMLGADYSSDQVKAIGDFVSAFIGDTISLRVLACGSSDIEYGFSGALLGRKEYMQEEREHLYSLYGSTLTGWTSVLQLTAIPNQSPESTDIDDDLADDTGVISRAKTELMAKRLQVILEQVGAMAGPRWPAISAIPIGIYRNIF